MCVSESVCVRMRAEEKGPRRMCVGVGRRDRSGEYGALRDQRRIKKAARSDETDFRFGEAIDYSTASGCVLRVESAFEL